MCSSLGNYVWFDANNNGVIEATEAGAPNVTVLLINATTGATVATTATNSGGYYLFSCVADGTYKVQISAPSGYMSSNPTGVETYKNPMSDPSDFDDNGVQFGATIESATFLLSASATQPVGETTGGLTDNVADDHSNLTVDFGLFRPAVTATTSSTTTTVAGATTTTTAAGSTTTVPGATTTMPGGSTPGTGSLCSEIYVDTNGNGQHDAGEPALVGVTVSVNGPTSKTATSDANGKYCFNDLPNGTYTVTLVAGVPAEYGYLSDQVITVQVLGVTAERPTAVFRVAPLAFTGSQSGRLAGFGIGLVLAGGVLILQGRRPRRAAAHAARLS